MWREIRDRETGKLRPNLLSNRIKSTRIQTLQLSNHEDIISPHRGSVNSFQLDLTEGRYLLSGASDASATVFDVQRGTDYVGGGAITRHKCLFVVDKQHEHGHKYAVSSAVWYPVDAGLFVTGSYDHHINVWDTNTMQVVMDFKMPGKVYRTAMSLLATSHMLIAAGPKMFKSASVILPLGFLLTPCLASAVDVMVQYVFWTLDVLDVFMFWTNLSLSLGGIHPSWNALPHLRVQQLVLVPKSKYICKSSGTTKETYEWEWCKALTYWERSSKGICEAKITSRDAV